MSAAKSAPFVVSVLTAVAAFATFATLAAQQAATPSPGGTRVLVDVQVRRAGQPAPGLSAADFVLSDSGVPQTLEWVPIAGMPVNLILALDTSASLRGPVLDQLKAASRAAFAALRPGDQGALVTFSQNVSLRAGWSSDQSVLGKAIDGITAQGSAAVTDAAFAALAMRGRPGSRTLVLMFTDGDDTASWLSAGDLVQVARRADAVVASVTLSGPANTGGQIATTLAPRDTAGTETRAVIAKWLTDEPGLYRGALLPMLAIETGGETIQVSDPATLTSAFAGVVARFAERYLLGYVPTGVPPTGWHPITIDVKSGGDVTVRSGYLR